ncbi:MAG: hypothetical protein SF182_14875 [Deltaproteobacteria bacterium]|nr:hypothetical protein [Deltaproteobacteria bacterium]
MRLFLRVLLLLALATPAAAKPVRVFVVNPRVELRYADTYANYRDKMFALVDGQHPRRAELVQPDTLDIAAHLRPRDPDAPADALILFPEDVGLAAGLIGSRGETARGVTATSGGSTVAFLALTFGYTDLVQYYAARYPGLAGIGNLFLATTDTSYRAVYETFRDLARTYGVYVAASVNVAPARRVEAAEDPQLVARLRDPDEPERDYAYEAVGGRPVNTLFVFAPDGAVLVSANGQTLRSPEETGGVLRGSFDKAYLTELELDPLGLVGGAVRDLDVLDTAVGRLATVTSKDAWMLDVNDRYDAKRPQLVIQPEAFDQWAFVTDPWAPDGFKAGGFAQVQRNPSFLFNLTPCLVGNLFDVTFDGQGAVIGKRSKRENRPAAAWIGQPPDRGLLAVAPWVSEDPGGVDLAARRAALVADGRALLPTSGVACEPPNGPGICENGYRESILQADLELPGDTPPAARQPGPSVPTAFGSASFVAPNPGGEQRHPRVAASGDDVYVAWQDARHGNAAIYLAVSRDRGAHFAVKRVSDHAAGAVVELRPALAVAPHTGLVYVAWQEWCDASDDDCGRIMLARFDRDGNKLGADLRVDDGGDAGKWNVALTVDGGGNPLLAWVDERDDVLSAGAALPLEHIYFARSRDRGRSVTRNVRVDRGAPLASAATLDHKWAPALAVREPYVHVAWTDFRNYQWDIYTARSRSGRHFETNRRVDDGVTERLNDHPAIAVGARGDLHVAWADRRRQDPDTDIRYARGIAGGRRFSASQRLDRGSDANQWFPVLAAAGADLVVAWQDNRHGDNDIFFAASADDGMRFAPDQRLDDSGDDASEQTRPDLTIDAATHTVWAVWEDDRRGPAAIALAARPLPAGALGSSK